MKPILFSRHFGLDDSRSDVLPIAEVLIQTNLFRLSLYSSLITHNLSLFNNSNIPLNYQLLTRNQLHFKEVHIHIRIHRSAS